MRRIYLIIFLLPLYMFANSGDVSKGKTYYQYILKPMLHMKGDAFTNLHTQTQWKKLFSNNAKGFIKEYSKTKELEEFLHSKKFKKICIHLKAFTLYYAKDSGVVPECSE